MNLVGHDEAGKTSLFKRLTGEEMKIDEQSTEGIATHLIKSFLKKTDLAEVAGWNEITLDVEEIVKDFNDQVLSLAAPHLRAEVPLKEVEIPPLPEQKKVPLRKRIWRKLFNRKKSKDEYPTDVPVEAGRLEHPTAPHEVTEGNSRKQQGTTLIPQGQGEKRQVNRKILDQLLSHQSKSKIGLDIIEYFLRIWDYGGQTEFYTTHHMFLNADAVNTVVMDISKPLREPLHPNKVGINTPGIPQTPLEFLHYWINTIHNDASQKNLEPSIALVLTHKDEIPGNNVDQYIQEYIGDVLQSMEKKSYSKYLSRENIFVVDNKHGEDHVFEELKGKLLKKFTEQKSWGMEKPVKWLRLEADIVEKAKEDSVGYLPRNVVAHIAEPYNMRNDDLEAFLQFHHQLGDFVYYPDPALRDVVITNPQWLVDQFKSLITPHKFLEKRNLDPEFQGNLKQGVASPENLQLLWKGNDVDFLTELFNKFNLMLPVESTPDGQKMFLIPSLLPPRDVSIYDTEPFKNKMLVYNAIHKPQSAGVLPVGTFHKFLCHCSKNPPWHLCAEDHISYTDASFQIADGVRLALTNMKGGELRCSIWCSRKDISEDKRNLIINTRLTLAKSLRKMNIPEGHEFLMLCPHGAPKDEYPCLVKVKEIPDELGFTGSFEAQNQECSLHQKPLKYSDFTWDKEIIYNRKFLHLNSKLVILMEENIRA